MDQDDVVSFECPSCRAELYREILKDNGGMATWVRTADSPFLEKDERGYFMKCGHCRQRIAMVPLIQDKFGGMMGIDRNQKYDRTISPRENNNSLNFLAHQ